MKYICIFVCVLVTVVCIHGQGIPIRKCPPGEHSVLYCPRKAEPDCINPTVHTPSGPPGACDVPDCFCNVPTVRDLRTRRCVPLNKCKAERS